MIEQPATGGSYRRQKDGSLQRVGEIPPEAVAPAKPSKPAPPSKPRKSEK